MTVDKQPLSQLEQNDAFIQRHIGPDQADKKAMLDVLGLNSVGQLIDQTVPESIRLKQPMVLGKSQTEQDALATLKKMAAKNKVYKSYIGMGYHDTITPNVILRNVLENPGWYTAYTPYQPEISQGRLEGLLNFQQMIMDLTGMDLANASLLDEATAAAEAMALCKRSNRKKTNNFFVADDVHPQTLDVIKTRAEYFGFDIIVGNPYQDLASNDVFGVLLQYPTTEGDIGDISRVITAANEQKAMVVVAADIMSLVLLKSPGELGADVVIGSAQRFGVPMGYGGPHAAFFATKDKLKRSTPGRIIGVSKDTRGQLALRMAMQTREQHIRREKATSNICTAQALLANMAGFYAVYHGPQGLKTIATRIHRLAAILAAGLAIKGIERVNEQYFDTLTLKTNDQTEAIYQRALAEQVNVRKIGADKISIALDETTTAADIQQLWSIVLGADHGQDTAAWDQQLADQGLVGIVKAYQREDDILTHPVFNQHHSETEMLRYLKQLENKDISLTHSMIPLGSCTMKLNATAEMIPVSWPEFSQIHPFAPKDQTLGYQEMLNQLADWLIEMTGYDALSHQPNSGAQGEYAGLLAISAYHKGHGNSHRTVCLIPSSAHGTNPASASMLGMDVVIVDCDDNGNVNIADLAAKAEKYADKLSCIMITYPSTHGVYEEGIQEICRIVHQYGGQVYLDGANLNAQVGFTSPGLIGADVSHLNLHKTFCIPHGGGGPGMGPIGVKAHLAPFLPNHSVNPVDDSLGSNGAVSAAPFGSASILPISWVYIALMGTEGMRQATEVAILNANYITEQLSDHFPILYRGSNGRVAHECIIDLRPIKVESGISEEDVAKRLMDFGFHAPTMSFPVPGTLMIEPTESESKAELDRFIDAMITIRQEISKVASGEWQADNNPLVNAPHTLADITDIEWNRSYSREEAVFPLSWLKQQKVWPTANRIDNVYGDRNLICSCPTAESYRTE